MGIPSYYKRLIDRYPRLVQKGGGEFSSDVLLMDFNCLIYQCVRSDSLPTYTAATRIQWENALIELVKEYTVKVWAAAGKPVRVFIGVDGVVPMAKIRQQRLRRFKSRWLAAAEMDAGVRKPGEEFWDTNSITPGTEFMERLGRALQSLAAARSTWTVSTADEPGEGEQKLMAWVRTHRAEVVGKQVIVYGLDADLIVLSLIGAAVEVPEVGGWRLLRELAEFEGRRAGESFGALDIIELLGILSNGKGMSPAEYVLEYACGMSFLGNDFLPHSLSVKMREGGHDIMRESLSTVHAKGLRLVRNGCVQRDACLALVRCWVGDEEANIVAGFNHKYKMRPGPPKSDRERLMMHVENLPIEWAAENVLWTSGKGLVPDWREIYRRAWLQEGDVGRICAEYARGLQWILDYYLGRPVSYLWYYPWNLPPLWVDLEQEFLVEGSVTAPPSSLPIAPQEQLAMVLPIDSWWLVRDTALRCLPGKAATFWPRTFGFFSVGRRWLWECEAAVPILTAERMREIRG